MKIVFATNNNHKLKEIKEILGSDFEIVSLRDIGCDVDIPETADTLEGNASIKSRYIYEHYGLDCFADDTGLEVDVLGGEPGFTRPATMITPTTIVRQTWQNSCENWATIPIGKLIFGPSFRCSSEVRSTSSRVG